MHGVIFQQLKAYVGEKLGPQAWNELLAAAGRRGNAYVAVKEYPDEELLLLVATASRVTGIPVNSLVEDFGAFIVPGLLNMFRFAVRPEWRTLDFLEHTEDSIHTVVRARNPGARPPELKATRVSPREVVIRYNSARKLCPLVRGIAAGAAAHFRERLQITETRCMHKGRAECEFHFTT